MIEKIFRTVRDKTISVLSSLGELDNASDTKNMGAPVSSNKEYKIYAYVIEHTPVLFRASSKEELDEKVSSIDSAKFRIPMELQKATIVDQFVERKLVPKNPMVSLFFSWKGKDGVYQGEERWFGKENQIELEISELTQKQQPGQMVAVIHESATQDPIVILAKDDADIEQKIKSIYDPFEFSPINLPRPKDAISILHYFGKEFSTNPNWELKLSINGIMVSDDQSPRHSGRGLTLLRMAFPDGIAIPNEKHN